MADEEGGTARSAAWGVAAVLFGGGAFATWPVAVARNSTFPIWPTYVFAGIAALSLYMCFATILSWWPAARTVRGSSAGTAGLPAADHGLESAAIDSGTSTALARSAPTAPVSFPTPPVAVHLKPEVDVAMNRLRLGALNRGVLGHFRVEVIDVHNQNGDWAGPRSWPVPWLEDGSVTSKAVPMFGKPLLDFAHFDFLALREDLEGTKWLRGDHWVFPSLPEPVKFRYSAVRAWSDLSEQYIIVTLRVIRNEPEGHVDVQFKIGADGTQPYCLELPETRASGTTPQPTDPRLLRDLAVNGRLARPAETEPEPDSTPAATDRWRHTSDGAKVPSLMRLTHTGLFHPGYNARQPQDEPPSIKIGMLVACRPIDPSSSGTGLRAKLAAFLSSAAVLDLIGALTYVAPEASWKNLAGHGPRTLEAALTIGDNPMECVPVASALFLPPTAGEALYGRDGRSATLILYIEPRGADGGVPPASDLHTWHRHFSLALAVTRAFAEFLQNDLGLGAFGDPPPQFGVWLKSYQPLTILVDTKGLRVLPGSSPSNQFMGWAYADPNGNSIAATARDLLVELCEYALHLDAFDQTLAAFKE